MSLVTGTPACLAIEPPRAPPVRPRRQRARCERQKSRQPAVPGRRRRRSLRSHKTMRSPECSATRISELVGGVPGQSVAEVDPPPGQLVLEPAARSRRPRWPRCTSREAPSRAGRQGRGGRPPQNSALRRMRIFAAAPDGCGYSGRRLKESTEFAPTPTTSQATETPLPIQRPLLVFLRRVSGSFNCSRSQCAGGAAAPPLPPGLAPAASDEIWPPSPRRHHRRGARRPRPRPDRPSSSGDRPASWAAPRSRRAPGLRAETRGSPRLPSVRLRQWPFRQTQSREPGRSRCRASPGRCLPHPLC